MEIQLMMANTRTRKGGRKREKRIFYLSEEIFERILLRLPLRPLTRFKCVSKAWCRQITELRWKNHTYRPIFSSCLTLHTYNRRTILLSPNDHGDGHDRVYRKIKSVKLPKLHLLYLIDVQSGWHLYVGNRRSQCSWFFRFYMTSTLHNKVWKFPKIPTSITSMNNYRNKDKVICFSVINASRYEFELMCFSIGDDDVKHGKLKYSVFSSSKWEWRYEEAEVFKPSGYCDFEAIRVSSQVFRHTNGIRFKGNLCWLFEKIILVYDFKEKSFRIVESPKAKRRNLGHEKISRPSGVIWQTEGTLHYCHKDDSGLCIWTYVGDHGDCNDGGGGDGEQEELSWKLKQRLELRDLGMQMHQIRRPLSGGLVQPLVFHHELQVLYLDEPTRKGTSVIVSYSLETRKISKVWSSPPYFKISRAFLSPLEKGICCWPPPPSYTTKGKAKRKYEWMGWRKRRKVD